VVTRRNRSGAASMNRPDQAKPLRFSLFRMMLAVTLAACGMALLRSMYLDFTSVEMGEHQQSVDWLPNTASDISYYRSYSLTAYEFTIAESEFLAWSRFDLLRIEKPVSVLRYCCVSARLAPLDGSTADEAKLIAYMNSQTATVSNGWYYKRRRQNGGGITMAYDRETRRAFVETSLR
jgi:hypothetical protein